MRWGYACCFAYLSKTTYLVFLSVSLHVELEEAPAWILVRACGAHDFTVVVQEHRELMGSIKGEKDLAKKVIIHASSCSLPMFSAHGPIYWRSVDRRGQRKHARDAGNPGP